MDMGATMQFIIFLDLQTQVKTWISKIANSKITSAKSQLDASEEYKISKTDAGLFSHFALSASGYDYLEVSKSKQPHGSKPQNRPDTVPDPTGEPAPFYADSFQQGIKSRQTVLLDPSVEQWEEGFKASIDAVIIIAADNPADLADAEIEVSKELIDLAAIATVETGLTLRRKFETTVDGTDIQKKFGNVVEHFGYADGVSQPAFLQQKLKGVSSKHWQHPGAPLKLVLIDDPNGTPSCGEDFGDRNAPVEFGLSSSRSPNTSWIDTSLLAQDQYGNPQGFVQLVETQDALNLRQAQRAAAFQFIARPSKCLGG